MKNDISHITQEHFDGWLKSLFGYQLRCRDVKNDSALPRTRNILKAHQVGMSYYFSGEALEDAVLTGDNQIFLTSTPEMADVYRELVRFIAQRFLDITLTDSSPIILSNGAELHFLSLDSHTFAGKAGHVYVDEYFWSQDCGMMIELANSMAMHKRWRKTYFSSVSNIHGMARNFWTCSHWIHMGSPRFKIDFPSENELRDGGRVCPDRQWRYVITIIDAIRLGCDLFDIDELKDEYTHEEFDRLFMCRL